VFGSPTAAIGVGRLGGTVGVRVTFAGIGVPVGSVVGVGLALGDGVAVVVASGVAAAVGV